MRPPLTSIPEAVAAIARYRADQHALGRRYTRALHSRSLWVLILLLGGILMWLASTDPVFLSGILLSFFGLVGTTGAISTLSSTDKELRELEQTLARLEIEAAQSGF